MHNINKLLEIDHATGLASYCSKNKEKYRLPFHIQAMQFSIKALHNERSIHKIEISNRTITTDP